MKICKRKKKSAKKKKPQKNITKPEKPSSDEILNEGKTSMKSAVIIMQLTSVKFLSRFSEFQEYHKISLVFVLRRLCLVPEIPGNKHANTKYFNPPPVSEIYTGNFLYCSSFCGLKTKICEHFRKKTL